MPDTYRQVYIQAVFAVKYRRAMLDKAWRAQVFALMGNLINETGCKNIIVNGVEDHVHCFFSMGTTVTFADLMKIVKAKSSKYINDHNLTDKKFQWQRGYAVFSYSKSHADNVYHYIKRQEQHHQKQTFKAEHEEYLRNFEIEYDEKYLFDDLI